MSITNKYEEFQKLTSTLGLSVYRTFVQKREHPDPRTFFGHGKIDEIAEFVCENDIDLVLINDCVKPLQHYNLEKSLKVECVDRVGLILKIFNMRATTRESKLQLESARLTYELPLLKEWIHRSKSSEHPGFMAGGEYRIDIYYDKIKKRLIKISKEIEQIREDRRIKRDFRTRMGFKTAVLFGYTNAGKSTLFNNLTKSSVFVDEKLFSTLSDTSRKVMMQLKRTIILTDTIGFVEDMPHWLIESFRPTIEEIQDTDCIVWIFDGTDNSEDLRRKYHVCKEAVILAGDKRTIPVITKSDVMGEEEVKIKIDEITDLTGVRPCTVSGKTGTGIDELVTRLKQTLSFPIRAKLILKNKDETQNILSRLYEDADIERVDYGSEGNSIIVYLSCELKDLNMLKSKYRNLIKKIDVSK